MQIYHADIGYFVYSYGQGKGVGRKIFRGGGQRKKRPKISKKCQKITLFNLFQGGQRKKDRKIAKKAKK